MKVLTTCVVLAILTTSLSASAPFDETLKLFLRDSPNLYQLLESSLEFREKEWPKGVPLLKVDKNDPAQGMRSTWTFHARRKGETGVYPLRVSISIVYVYFDGGGKPVFPSKGLSATKRIEGLTIIDETANTVVATKL